MRVKCSHCGVFLSFVILSVCAVGAALGFAQTQSQSAPAQNQTSSQSQSQNTGQSQSPGQSQTPTPPADSTKADAAKAPEITQDNNSEVSTHESDTAFRVPVNLVLVRVVVRDEKGKIVGNLKKEDFRLFDNHKPQAISHFSSETPKSKPVAEPAQKTASAKMDEMVNPEPPKTEMERPSQFMALLFDDSDSSWEDLMRSRKAAENFINSSMPADERI